MLSIGFVGYSAQKFDAEKARELIASVLDTFDRQICNGIEVVSGLTACGIPKIAYEEADARFFWTVGIACSKASSYECHPVNESIIVGSNWGDESEAFLDRIDVLVRVGGGKQSHAEVAQARAMDKEVIEFELEAIAV